MVYDIGSNNGISFWTLLTGISVFKMSSTHLILITILGWGIGSFFYKTANNNLHPMMVSIIVTSFYVVWDICAITFIPFNKTVNSTGIIYTLLGAFFMGIGSLTYFFALRNGQAGSTTALTGLYPAVTLILASFFLKETITIKSGIGIALAITSFLLLSSK